MLTNPQGVALGRREHGRRHLDRGATAAPLRQRLPRRQLLRLVHHQHHAARGPARLAQDGPGQRYQHRRRQHHHVDPAHVRRHRQRAQSQTGARWPARRPSSTSASTVVNGVSTTFFDAPAPRTPATSLSSSARTRAPRPRPPAARSRSRWGSTEPIPGSSPTPLPCPTCSAPTTSGSTACLSPLPGDDSGYYVARVRIIDQSGNQSNPNDPNAQLPFIVDTTPPDRHVHFADLRPGDHVA